MAIPERDTVYTNDGTNRSVYTRESSSTGWFVGIIVALALLAIGYLVFSANSGPSKTAVNVNNSPAITSPANPATTPAPTTQAPAATEPAPMTSAPAPTSNAPAPANSAPAASSAPAATEPAPAAQPAAPATSP